MARVIKQRWPAALGAGLSRADRRPCEYEAYVPDSLAGRRIVIHGEVAADVADAERAISRLEETAVALVDTEALARLLLRAESVASSKIEGLEVGGRRLLRAQASRELGDEVADVTAEEVLGNVDAMAWAIRSIKPGDPISVEAILEVHRRLLAGTPLAPQAGQIRTGQNWIGGSEFNPCNAAFVPPPPNLVPELLDDLGEFCNQDSLPAVAQAALAHAQFETIHPFADGNGRTGRALIHMVLRRRGLATRVIVPVSLVLATWSRTYIAMLTETRYRGAPDATPAVEARNRWIAFFASASLRAVDDAGQFETRVDELEEGWRRRVGRVRARSSVDLLLRALPGAPIITVNSARDMLGRSFPQVNAAIARLVDAGVLRQMRVGRRNRAFEAPELIDAFTMLERRLASPEGNTRLAPPVRAVPRRR